MARIVDKDTRLIDCDFGPLTVNCARDAATLSPTTVTSGQNGEKQLILLDGTTGAIPGSFVQYSRIDLEYMTMNNEVMQPLEVSIQRTSPVPLGYNNNGNTFDQIEEYIYIFSRPLNNEAITNGVFGVSVLDDLRKLGLDRSQNVVTSLGGIGSGIPTHEQTIYAEKRMYSYSSQLMATVANGGLVAGNPLYNELAGMPVLDSVTTWGTMSAITGPSIR